MGLFKKIGGALKKAIKPDGLLSKIVGKIPVIGGVASGAIDVVGGIVQKISPKKKGTATKPTAGQSFAEAYQATAGVTAASAIDTGSTFEAAAGSPVTSKFINIGVLVGVAVLAYFLLFKRK